MTTVKAHAAEASASASYSARLAKYFSLQVGARLDSSHELGWRAAFLWLDLSVGSGCAYFNHSCLKMLILYLLLHAFGTAFLSSAFLMAYIMT